MKIDVEVISREIIKPSTPTPDHLRYYQFSLLDQLSPPCYVSLIYFYDNTVDHNKLGSHNDISSKLKLSLSKVLTHYYLLAGCLKDNYVDCNDEGVLFLEAQVDCQLSQFVEEPFTREFNKFLPYDGLKNSIFAIQVNFFKCGRFAIGALLSHKIADASSMITFIRNWAATARDGSPNFRPQFVSAALFPPRDLSGLNISFDTPPEENFVLKRFVFSGSAMAALKEKYTEGTSLGNDDWIHPSRVEALSSFIWSRFTASTGTKKGLERLCFLFQSVNLRTRIDPPLHDDHSFGNMVEISVNIFSELTGREEEDQYGYGVVRKFRDCKNKVNNVLVRKLQEGAFQEMGLLKLRNDERLFNQESSYFGFTSFCRFPVYETDFGWGRPVWVATGGFSCSNFAVLIDTKCGDGIEAWIHLKKEDMPKFEIDKELLSFISFGQDFQA